MKAFVVVLSLGLSGLGVADEGLERLEQLVVIQQVLIEKLEQQLIQAQKRMAAAEQKQAETLAAHSQKLAKEIGQVSERFVARGELETFDCPERAQGCSFAQCQAHCQAKGKQVATVAHMMQHLGRGHNSCRWTWLKDGHGLAFNGMGAFSNFKEEGCGPLDTGTYPRIYEWSNPTADCACWAE